MIDDDVAVLIERARERRKRSLKDVVNDALRAGLKAPKASARTKRRHRTAVASLGPCLIGNLEDVSDALAIAEGENFR